MTDDWPPTFEEPRDPVHKCRHPRWKRRLEAGQVVCGVCTKPIDAERSARGRRANTRGRRIQKQSIEAIGLTNLPGNAKGLDGKGGMFRGESKSGKSFPELPYRWLKAIPVTVGQIAVLVMADTPGPGRRRRRIVILDAQDWYDLHGRDGTFELEPDPYQPEKAS